MKQKAFTFVELIVTMGIISSISLIGILGIFNFKASSEINSVYSNLTSSIKELRNKASNSVIYNDPSTGIINSKAPALYSIRFFGNSYSFYICNKISPSSNKIRCAVDKTTPTYSLPQGIEIGANYSSLGFTLLDADLSIVTLNAYSDGGNSGDFITTGAILPSSTLRIAIINQQFNLQRLLNLDITYDKLDF